MYLDITVITLVLLNIFLCGVGVYYTIQPKIVQITKDPEGTSRQAIITPSGTFHVPKKRDPINNDDETLWLREQDNDLESY